MRQNIRATWTSQCRPDVRVRESVVQRESYCCLYSPAILMLRDTDPEMCSHDSQGRNSDYIIKATKKRRICWTSSRPAVIEPCHTSCSLAACVVLTLNLISSAPAAAPGSPSCGAPPDTCAQPPHTSGSNLCLWKIQLEEQQRQ